MSKLIPDLEIESLEKTNFVRNQLTKKNGANKSM